LDAAGYIEEFDGRGDLVARIALPLTVTIIEAA
jgi:hypothetical protein